MAGPWEDFQKQAGPSGPWSDFAPPAAVAPSPKQSQDIGDAVIAGLQSSSMGLVARGKLPDMQLGVDAPWYHRLGAGVGGLIGDAGPMLAGGFAGFAAGGAVGSAVPVVGTVAGAAVGAGAGAMAAPMAIREALIAAYNNNHASSWEDVKAIAFGALKGAAKGAVIGGATAGTGRVVTSLVAPVAGEAVMAGSLGAVGARRVTDAAALGSELSALTTSAAALDGHMPTWQDFMDNAILLGGLKATTATIAKNMRNVYADTGRSPEQILGDAKRDPAIADQLTGDDPKTAALAKVMNEIDALAAKYKNEPLIAQYFKDGDPDRGIARIVEKHSDELSKQTLDTLMPRMARDWETGESIMAADSVRGTHIFDLREEIAQRRMDSTDIPSAYADLALEQRVQAAVEKADKPELTKALLAEVSGERTELKGDLVRYEYLTSDESIKSVIRLIADANKDKIEAQRRGTVPVKESLMDAKELLASGELARHERGEADAPHEAVARAILVRDSAVRAKRLLVELNDTPYPDTMQKLEAQAAVEQVALFYGELSGGVAEAARTLRMMKELKRNPELLGDAESLLQLYNKRGKNIGDLAKMAKIMDDPDQMVKFANDLTKATTLEKALEVFRANIYSGFRTHEANMMGNIGKWFVDIPESAISATIFAGKKAMQGDPLTMAQFKARALAPFIGMQLGGIDGVKAAWNVFRMKEDHLEKMEVHGGTANTGLVGEYTGTVFRGLQSEDMIFRTPAERSQAYIMAVDRVVKEGIHPDTAEGIARTMQLTNNPTLGLTEKAAGEVNAEIYKAGAQAVYSERLGPRFEKVGQAIAGSWAQFVFPAYRTPVNLVSWAVQHTPLMNMLSARWWDDYNAGGERQAKALARVTVGAGLAAFAYGMTANGFLTGGGLATPEQNKTKSAAGEQKYSVKFGNQYYNIERMEPVAKPLMLIADLTELWKALPDAKDKAKVAYATILAFGNATISTTYLSGLANLIKGVTEPVRSANQLVESYASGLVVPKIVGQTVEAFDPYKREVDGALDAIASQVWPLRQKLLPVRDVWGEKVKNDKMFGVLPVAVTEATKDKVKSEAVRLQLAIMDAPKFLTQAGPLPTKDRQLKLSPEELDVMKEASGKYAQQMLGPLVNSPEWKNIPDFAQARIYRGFIAKGHVRGALDAIPADDGQRMALIQKQANEILRQVQEAETK